MRLILLCLSLFLVLNGVFYNRSYSKNGFLLRNSNTASLCNKERIDSGRSYENEDVMVSNCFFSRIHSSLHKGSVIFIDCEKKKMNISNSMFYSCSSSDDGGAIDVNVLYSDLRMICASNCFGVHHQFSRVIGKLYIKCGYLSIASCYNEKSRAFSLSLYHSNQYLGNTNSSMNFMEITPCFLFNWPSAFSGIYCTFSNNNASKGECLSFYNKNSYNNVSFMNIVNNISPKEILYSNGASLTMENCIIHSNTGYLFSNEDGTLVIDFCIISHIGNLSRSGQINICNKNSFSFSQTYQIPFFSSYYCETGFATEFMQIHFKNNLGLPIFVSQINSLESLEKTPYRSYGEPTPAQSLPPIPTPFESKYPVPTPPQTLYPEPTPPQTLYPEPTPPQTLYPVPTPPQTIHPDQSPLETQTPNQTPICTPEHTYSQLVVNTYIYSIYFLVLFVAILIIYISIYSTQAQKGLITQDSINYNAV